MNKVEKSCYNCKHNGKSSCKGCSTILIAGKLFENFRPRDEFRIIEKLEKQIAGKEGENKNLKNIVEGIDKLKQFNVNVDEYVLINQNNVYLEGDTVVVKAIEQDKMRTQWQKDMYAVKPIKFEPPMWKDLKKEVEEIKTSKEEVEVKCVLQFNNGEVVHSVYFVKSEDEYRIELTDDDQVNETFELSEAGYVLAVNKARMIFLGDENV